MIRSFRTDPRRNSYAYAAESVDRGRRDRDHVLAYEHLPNHGNGGMNVLFGDGNVRWLGRADAERMVEELSHGHNPPGAENALVAAP